MTSDNQSTELNLDAEAQNSTINQGASTSKEVDKTAPLGQLSATHHSLCKPKKDCKFKCKECEYVASSCKEANDHHKDQHDKCYCSIYKKACNTPSTLAHHVYSHKEDLCFPCSDCHQKFAFEGHLKQHHFKHYTLTAFPCSKCDKSYKHEGELVKHLKVHENKKYICT